MNEYHHRTGRPLIGCPAINAIKRQHERSTNGICQLCGDTRWDGRLTADFGERNEGIAVEADSPKDALAKFNADRLPGARYNPFYLKAEPV